MRHGIIFLLIAYCYLRSYFMAIEAPTLPKLATPSSTHSSMGHILFEKNGVVASILNPYPNMMVKDNHGLMLLPYSPPA